MTDATELDEAAVRARLEAATPGPWRVDEIARVWADRDPAGWDAFHIAACHDAVGRATDSDEANAEFIAHARTDLPAALDEITRLRAALDEARAEVADAHHEGFGCGVAWAVGDDEEAPPALLARAEAAESALAAVRALADRARQWVGYADASTGIEVFGDAWMHTTLLRELAALATPTTPENGDPE